MIFHALNSTKTHQPSLYWPPLRLYIRDVGQQYFPVMQLVSLQSEANYSWLIWADGQRMIMPRTLKWYMKKLPADWFIRFHRNCIVNRFYISRLEKTKTGLTAYLTTGETIAISRRRWVAVRRQLGDNRPDVS